MWPRLVEVLIDDGALVEMNYSEGESCYTKAVNHALRLAATTLCEITKEEDLFEAILDKEYNIFYPNIAHQHIKVLCTGVIYNLNEKIAFKDAFTKAEEHFAIELPNKELLLAYLKRKQITSAENFA